MPSTSKKSRSEDMDSDDERVVTMMDVLQEQEDFEEDASAVLGASDDKNCTFSKGYIKRQALYVCFTCCPEAKTDPLKRAGVCLACSLTCHENHDLAELYTKRNFCCDCGNPKFNSHPCQYTPNKFEINEDNKYDQNFSGLYCVCHRPYPDPEATIEDDMIQCIVCEDWLHSEHLEATVPSNEDYAEMICKECMEKNKFLQDYSNFAVNTEDLCVTVDDNDKVMQEDLNENLNGKPDSEKENTDEKTEQADETKVDNSADVDMNDKKDEEKASIVDPDTSSLENKDQDDITNKTSEEDDKNENDNTTEEKPITDAADVPSNSLTEEKQLDTSSTEPNSETTVDNINKEVPLEDNVNNTNLDKVEQSNSDKNDDSTGNKEYKRKLSTDENLTTVTPKKPKIYEKNYCIRPKDVTKSFKGATFWPSNFRQKLCICNDCITMYKDLSVLFIIDTDDTVTAYEALGKKRNEGAKVSQYEKGLEALSSLDRVHQINALTEYNKMRDKLLDFLKSFKDRKEIVKEEDIKAFFAGMKPKREPDGVYFCR